jgi:hypothetical protein
MFDASSKILFTDVLFLLACGLGAVIPRDIPIFTTNPKHEASNHVVKTNFSIFFWGSESKPRAQCAWHRSWGAAEGAVGRWCRMPNADWLSHLNDLKPPPWFEVGAARFHNRFESQPKSITV